jgi:DNA-binding MarR family transcriptional regulator
MKNNKQEVSELKKHIGFWMRFVSNHVSSAFARKLAKNGLSVAEWVVLREVYENGSAMAPSVLSHHTGMTRGAISKLVDRLLGKGLILRKGAENDRRYQEITLTQEAKKLLPVLGKLADQNDDEFFQVLSAEERKTLTDLIKKVAHLNKLTKLPTD